MVKIAFLSYSIPNDSLAGGNCIEEANFVTYKSKY